MSPLLRSLVDDLPRLSVDEQRVFRKLLDRCLVQGRASYQPWRAAREDRDMVREALAETLDGCIYLSMQLVMTDDERQQRLACQTADKIVASFECVDGEVSEVLR